MKPSPLQIAKKRFGIDEKDPTKARQEAKKKLVAAVEKLTSGGLWIDRVNDEVNYLYDPFHPGVLRLIATILDAGSRAGIPVAMCGEMAGDRAYTRLLVGLGLTEFSVHPAALLEIKHIVNNTSAESARAIARQLLDVGDGARRRALLEELNAHDT